MDMQSTCPTVPVQLNQSCNCDYIPPTITKLLVRKNKKGGWQVKINGKGKWIAADYDEKNNIVRFLS